MYKIKRTKEPTLKIMREMASNLEEKFGEPSSIDVGSWGNRDSFLLYVSHYYISGIIHTWDSLLDLYFKVMKMEKEKNL